MAEETPDLTRLPRAEAYDLLEKQLDAVLAGETDPIARMATVSCLLHFGLGNLWTGFYRRVAPGLLKVGPYQGTLGCLDIAFGRGVCGTAAAQKRTVVVPDVARFPGHIACDARSRSEIVVPVLDAAGEVVAVLDLDADRLAHYTALDAERLERLVARLLG
jgi:L-methionine (R)-S-oxide reductase